MEDTENTYTYVEDIEDPEMEKIIINAAIRLTEICVSKFDNVDPQINSDKDKALSIGKIYRHSYELIWDVTKSQYTRECKDHTNASFATTSKAVKEERSEASSP